MKEKQDSIPSLDGLRAVSIILVIVGHAVKFPENRPFWFRLLFLHSGFGVRVFFVISGFLITTLLLQERSRFGNISLRLFYARRALRILPAAFLFLACVAVLSAFGIVQVPARDWAYVLTYTVNFTGASWAVGHLWSLSVEEQFYLAWPFLMRLASIRTCAAVAAAAVFAGIAIRAVYSFTGVELIDPALRYAFPFVCGPIAMGCLLALGSDRVRELIGSSKLLRSGTILIFLLPLIALLDSLDLGTANRFLELLSNALVTLCVARFAFFPEDAAGRFLNSALMVWIGRLSYSLYLWQQLFLNPFSPAPFSWIGLPAVVACASASYYGVEARFLKLRKRLRRKEHPAIAVHV